MRRRIFGLVMAGGMVLGLASSSRAQVSVSIGNPFTGTGISIGNPYGAYNYGYGINGYGNPYYGPTAPGLGSVASPYYAPSTGITSYSSGYSNAILPGNSWNTGSYYPSAPISSSIYPYSLPAYGYGNGFGSGYYGVSGSGYGFAPAYGSGIYGLSPRSLIRGVIGGRIW